MMLPHDSDWQFNELPERFSIDINRKDMYAAAFDQGKSHLSNFHWSSQSENRFNRSFLV
jgi:hypothetical protein